MIHSYLVLDRRRLDSAIILAVLLFLADLTFASPAVSQAQPNFVTRFDYSTIGRKATAATTADFDGDGADDLAVCLAGLEASPPFNHDQVVVLKGDLNNPGVFLPPVGIDRFDVGGVANSDPVAIVSAAVDNDPTIDLIVANYAAGDLTIIYNPADGNSGNDDIRTFALSAGSPTDLAFGDVAFATDTGVAVSHGTVPAQVSIFSVNAVTHNLEEDPNSPFQLSSDNAVAIVPFNFANFKGDLAVATTSDESVHFLIKGLDAYSESTTVAELNGVPMDMAATVLVDGLRSIAVAVDSADPSAQALNVVVRTGVGVDVREFNVVGDCTAVAIADLVEDPSDPNDANSLDVVVSHGLNDHRISQSSILTVMRNTGTGQGFMDPTHYHTARNPSAISVFTYDHDGSSSTPKIPSVAVTSDHLLGGNPRPETSFVSAHLNTGSNSFVSDTVSDISVDPNELEGLERLALTQINPVSCQAGGDDNIDAVVTARLAKKILVCTGNGDGTFNAPHQISVGSTREPQDVTVGKINGGDAFDIVSADIGTGVNPATGAGMTYLKNRWCETGTVTFGKHTLPDHPTTPNKFAPQSVLLIDYNSDQDDDLITGVWEPDPLDPDGVPLSYQLQIYQWVDAACDPNFPFICTAEHFDLKQELFLSNNAQDIESDSEMALGDLDDDSHVDLVVALQGIDTAGVPTGESCDTGTSDGGFVVFWGTGDPNSPFLAPTYVLNDGNCLDARNIEVGDFIPGGALDIAVASHCNDSVVIYENSGTRTFTHHESHLVGSWPNSLEGTDFNGDGSPDLVVACRDSNNVAVLLRMASETGGKWYSKPFFVGAGTEDYFLDVGDIDEDAGSRNDIVTVNRGSDALSALLNSGNQ